MRMSGIRKGVYVAAAVGALAGSLLGVTQIARAAGPPVFNLAPVGAFGGEPSLTSDSNGVLYTTTPSGPQTYRSTNQGASWTQIQSPDNNSGDDCLNTDAQNSLYWCNLASTTKGNAPLQADVWKSTAGTITTCTASCNWQYGNNATTAGTCSTSCNPFGVDRQWVASSITGVAPSTDTAHALVVLMYHDFYGPSHIWVNVSTDGGATFGTAQEVLSGGVTNNPNGTVTAEAYTFCNTVPAGVGIVPPGKPHAGRIFVAWIASDLAQDATGCNISMAQSFHTAWVAYSDDKGATWSPQMAFDSGVGHDMSTPFVAFTLDNQGNPYIAFDTQAPTQNPATCFADIAAGTVQSDKICGYNMYVVWSHDGGNTWDGGGGKPPRPGGQRRQGVPRQPGLRDRHRRVPDHRGRRPGQGRRRLPAHGFHRADLTAGQVHAHRLRGHHHQLPGALPLEPRDRAVAQPQQHPRHRHLHQGAGHHHADALRRHLQPRHRLPADHPDPRHLLDFNQETVDPTTGCAHIVYADDNAGATYGDPAAPSPFGNHLVAANQVDGPAIIGYGVCGAAVTTAEVPLSLLLPLAGAGVIVAVGVRRRRRGASPLSV